MFFLLHSFFFSLVLTFSHQISLACSFFHLVTYCMGRERKRERESELANHIILVILITPTKLMSSSLLLLLLLYLWIPQFTGYAQILTASHQCIGFCRLAGLPVAQVPPCVERVLPRSLGHVPPQTVQSVLSRYQLGTLDGVVKVHGFAPGHERPASWTKCLV